MSEDQQVTLDELKDSPDRPKAAHIEHSAFGDIPNGWTWEQSKGHLKYIESGISESQNKNGNGIPVSRIETIADGVVNYEKVGYVGGDTDYSKHRLKSGDLLFSNINSRKEIGKTAIYHGEKPLYHGMNLLRLRYNSDSFNPYFAYYVYDSPMAQNVFFRMSKAAVGQSSINQSQMERFFLPTPPLLEQRKIATVLHTVDQAIEKTKEIESQVRRTQKGTVQDTLKFGLGGSDTHDTGTKLGELPTHWEVTSIEEIVADEEYAFTDGARYSLSSAEIYEDGEARAILLQEVGEGEFNDEDPKFATEEKYDEITHRAIYPGEVVVAKMAEPVARACIVPDKYDKYLLGCADVVRIQTNDEFDDRFLMYCMNSHKVWRQAVAHLRGTGRSRINLENISELLLPKPPLSEQVEIADTLEEFDRRIQNEREYRETLERLKRGLMNDLLSGTVRTTDTNIQVPDEIVQHG